MALYFNDVIFYLNWTHFLNWVSFRKHKWGRSHLGCRFCILDLDELYFKLLAQFMKEVRAEIERNNQSLSPSPNGMCGLSRIWKICKDFCLINIHITVYVHSLFQLLWTFQSPTMLYILLLSVSPFLLLHPSPSHPFLMEVELCSPPPIPDC